MTVLGIDPGATCGLALVDIAEHRIIKLRTLYGRTCAQQGETVDNLIFTYRPQIVAIQVPRPRKGKFAFFHKGKDGKPISPASIVIHAGMAGWLTGFVACLGQLVDYGYATEKYAQFRVVEVSSQGRRGQGLKMDAKTFNAYWNYEGLHSKHARDAAAIALQGAKT